jgi:hypothetical protein
MTCYFPAVQRPNQSKNGWLGAFARADDTAIFQFVHDARGAELFVYPQK